MTVYTLGVWRVRPGREDEFVAAWDALARWTVESGYEWSGTLLRDRDDQARFVSVGPWSSAEVADRWRGSDGFAERIERLRELVESMDEPGVLDVVLRVSWAGRSSRGRTPRSARETTPAASCPRSVRCNDEPPHAGVAGSLPS